MMLFIIHTNNGVAAPPIGPFALDEFDLARLYVVEKFGKHMADQLQKVGDLATHSREHDYHVQILESVSP